MSVQSRLPALALRAWWSVSLAGVAALVALAVVGVPEDSVVRNALYDGIEILAAAALILRVAVGPARHRAVWALFAVGIATWAAGDVLWTVAYASPDTVPIPSAADYLWIVLYPASIAAVVFLLRERVRRLRMSLVLDAVVATSATVAVGIAVPVPAVISDSLGAEAAGWAIAYPPGDTLILASLAGAYAVSGWAPGCMGALLAIGLVTTTVADSLCLYAAAGGNDLDGTA